MAQNCSTVRDKLSALFKGRLALTQSPFLFSPINALPRGVDMATGSVSFLILTLRLRCRWGNTGPVNIDVSLLLSTSIVKS